MHCELCIGWVSGQNQGVVFCVELTCSCHGRLWFPLSSAKTYTLQTPDETYHLTLCLA